MQEDNNPYEVKSLSPALPMNDVPRWSILRSFLVMLPWPMLGIGVCLGLSIFEEASEAVLMFGGLTLIFSLPLGLVVSSEWIFGALIGLVWLLALVLPLWFDEKAMHDKFNVVAILAGQSLFSAIQAGLGFLMILGKSV